MAHRGEAQRRRAAPRRLPLVAPFRTSFGTETAQGHRCSCAPSARRAEGWGECVAMSEPLYSSEYVDAAEHVTAALPAAAPVRRRRHRRAPTSRRCSSR